MNFDNIKNALINAAKAAGLEEYEIFYAKTTGRSCETLKDEISSFSNSVNGGVSFRCVKNGRMGAASSELLEESEMQKLVERAISNAINIESDDKAIIYAGGDNYTEFVKVTRIIPSAADMKATALRLQKNIYDQSEYVTEGTQVSLFGSDFSVRLVNSYGLDLSNEGTTVGGYLSAVINKDGENEESYDYKDSTEFETLAPLVPSVVKESLSKLGACEVESGKYNIVISARQMRSFLSTYTSVFSAKNAQHGLSLLKGKEGLKIAADCITIIDDPMREGCPMQTNFDGEGVEAYRKNVIEGGILKTLLYDLSTADKAGKKSTGNGLRQSYSDAVSIRPYSFYFAPGDLSLEGLLDTCGNGIYVTELKGLHAGADTVGGDFSIESAGFLIEGGRLTKPVKSFTIAGNFFDFIKNITALSDTVEFGIPTGYTMIGSPAVLVPEISVAGK